MEPVTVAASMIAQLAFNEFIKSGSGELAKKTVGGAIEVVDRLRQRIREKFQGNTKAESAMTVVEQQGSEASLTKLGVYLDDAMAEDPVFATEVQQMAQQIINIQNQNVSGRQYTNYGRDQINIETIQGNPKIGG